jgi:hypothetical protein
MDVNDGHGHNLMVSRWELEPGDLDALKSGAPVFLSIMGIVHPVVCVYVGGPASYLPRDPDPIPMLLFCPNCGQQHIDQPDPSEGWDNPPHASHKCVGPNGCGAVWRPADVTTTGVERIQTRGKSDNYFPHGRLILGREEEPVAWLRDLDGTGSMHVCAKGDPGAIPVFSE